MSIKNITKKTILSKEYKLVTSLEDNLLGLLKKSNPRTLIFNTRFGIHTFFLKEAIDVIVLNRNIKVVKLKQNLDPNNIFIWKPVYNLIIELPAGTVKKSHTVLGDKLSF